MAMAISARPWAAILFGGALAACAMQPAPPGDITRFLVYFEEFSADLSGDATRTVTEAAKSFRDNAARAIRIEGRASATGSVEVNKKLAATRTQIVADELVKDGIERSKLRQVDIGETGSNDPSVAERRVDIVLER